MYHLVVIAALVVGALGAPYEDIFKHSGKVVGGVDANAGEFPFLLSLQYSGRHRCGGTILSANYGLTAAHCVDGISSGLRVMVGSIYLSSPGQYSNVVSFTMHPNYDPSSYWENDVAVLKFESPITLGNLIKPVALLQQGVDTPGGTPATVAGWGYVTDGSLPDRLQKANIQVYSDEDCSEIHGGKPHSTNICAGVPEGWIGQCNGDSGGPLIVDGNQVGIVSWSVKPCAVPPFPGVYTQVSAYIDWIKQNTDRT